MVTKVAVVQKVALQNSPREQNPGLCKRKSTEKFKDVLAAAIRKVARRV